MDELKVEARESLTFDLLFIAQHCFSWLLGESFDKKIIIKIIDYQNKELQSIKTTFGEIIENKFNGKLLPNVDSDDDFHSFEL